MTTAKRGNRKKKGWSYSAGEWGRNRVRAFAERRTGLLFIEFHSVDRESGTRRRRRRSLGHRDRSKAKRDADRLAAHFAAALPTPSDELTLAELFEIYLAEVTPSKGKGKRDHDHRTSPLFVECFGKDFKAHALSRREWDLFIRQRRTGAVAPPRSRGRKVGNRQIEYDLKFLLSVLNWATEAGDGQGGRLLDRNPFTKAQLPSEESPTRVCLSQNEYEALTAVAGEVDWRFELALVVAHETGNRIGSIRQLLWTDVDLKNAMIRWRRENDKIGFERTTPITADAVEALRTARKRHRCPGHPWVFPAPQDSSQACRGDLMTKWWNRAVRLARLEPRRRRGWHSLRRKFATEMKGAPTADMLELGGWRDMQTVLKCYQSREEGSMRDALERRKERAGEGRAIAAQFDSTF